MFILRFFFSFLKIALTLNKVKVQLNIIKRQEADVFESIGTKIAIIGAVFL